MRVKLSPKTPAQEEERSKAADSDPLEEKPAEASDEGKRLPNRLNAVRSSLAIGRSKQLIRGSKERIQKTKRQTKKQPEKKAG